MAEVRLLRVGFSAEAAVPPLRDVVQLLRNIADNLEAGQYGAGEAEVVRGALVLRVSGQEPHIFGLGDTDPTQTFMDFHAGAAQLMTMGSPARD